MIDRLINILSSGWACVGMFFVISGSLITPTRPSTPNNAPFGRDCWIRRTMRILLSISSMPVVAAVLRYAIARWLLDVLSSLGHLLTSPRPRSEKTRFLWLLASSGVLGTTPFILGGIKERLCQGL